MFISRATRHDLADIEELLTTHGWHEKTDLKEGVAYFARDGAVVGCVRLIEVAPQTQMVDSVLVREDRRRSGVGTALMKAAMNAKGGTMFLCCHEEALPFYAQFGFVSIPLEDCPPEVVAYLEKVGDVPAPEGHTHFYLKAR
ncbi:MAG: GNAT family N-acetyltransferase [Actinobacteria bacterium]|nr:GNAT family N-acetyltransferase [Actinomycetota bacterium]